MRYPLYEEPDGICLTYIFKENPKRMEVYAEIPTETGFDSAKYYYPNDRFCEVNMSTENMILFIDSLHKCRSVISDIWNEHEKK